MSNLPKFSNAMSNLDIMSYRAYKNSIISNNSDAQNKKSNFQQIKNSDKLNRYEDKKYSNKNLTKSVFSSQSKRFLWQTDEKVNRGSELLGSITDRRNSELNSKKWEGLICVEKENNNKYSKYDMSDNFDNNNKTPRKY